MNEEINELISHYEQEKELILSLLKADQLDNDLEAVYLNSKNLFSIERQIRTLKSMIDPHAKEKEMLEDQKKRLEALNIRQGMADFIKEKIQTIDHRINQLNCHSTGYFNDGQEFDDALFDLVEEKINAFIFYLWKDQLYLRFSIKRNQIRIRFTPFSEIPSQIYFQKENLMLLRIIGFRKNKSGSCLQIKLDLNAFKDTIPIKTIVSRVVYEALYNYNIANQNSFLVIQ
jgi:hypothetical protein